MQYVDSSVVVAALTNEAETSRMQTWLGRQTAGALAISEWVVTEFSAALSIKLRTGQVQTHERAASLAAFSRLIAESLEIWPISGAAFRVAARFADRYALGLRAGDALHLGVVAEHGGMIVTLDKRLADAASKLGLSAALL